MPGGDTPEATPGTATSSGVTLTLVALGAGEVLVGAATIDQSSCQMLPDTYPQ